MSLKVGRASDESGVLPRLSSGCSGEAGSLGLLQSVSENCPSGAELATLLTSPGGHCALSSLRVGETQPLLTWTIAGHRGWIFFCSPLGFFFKSLGMGLRRGSSGANKRSCLILYSLGSSLASLFFAGSGPRSETRWGREK